jgi:lipopolysaccharide transport system permease protein
MTGAFQLEAESWKYRRLLLTMVRRDLRSRFAGSSLGALWIFIQPLVTIALYVLVFSTIIKGGKFEVQGTTASYAAYLLPGLLAWSWANEALASCCNAVIGQGALLRKVAFPASLLPLTNLISISAPYALVLLVFCTAGCIAGWFEPVGIFLLPILILFQALCLIGLALALSSLTVYVRDLAQAIPTVLQALFWATPIVYTAEMVTSRYPGFAWFYNINPAYHLVSLYREALLLGRVPSLFHWAYLGALAIAAYILGRWLFVRLRGGFADES